jgi:muramoyltetrapeptide carboxypeptidase
VIERSVRYLSGLGIECQVAPHAFDEHGYLAGRDEDRLADINDAIRDPMVNAIFATRGGKGAYRIADGLDFDAMRRSPKLVVGFSEITILQMAFLAHCGVAAVHGACWDPESFGDDSAASFRTAVFTTEAVTVHSDPSEPAAELTTHGQVTGRLIGGNQDSISTAAGWALPAFDGAIVLLESTNMRLGHIDRQLTMLKNAGHLDGIVGIAVGQYTECGPDDGTRGSWTAIDVLRDRLSRFGVPILGGLPIGHGEGPIAVPIGTMAELNADVGVLRVAAAVS